MASALRFTKTLTDEIDGFVHHAGRNLSGTSWIWLRSMAIEDMISTQRFIETLNQNRPRD